MTSTAKTKRGNVVQLTICPTKMSIKTEKKYKEKRLKEIMDTMNGLFNCGGGTLKLRYEKLVPEKHLDDCIRRIEQKIVECTGVVTMILDVEVRVSKTHQVIVLEVGTSNKPCLRTLNYNLYLPSENQVILVSPSEPVENVRRLLKHETSLVEPTLAGSHVKDFIMGQGSGLTESKRVQLKSLKAERSKHVSLADRIVGKPNKMACYVSAFGNYGGGHIYYGVRDDGMVEGEKITKKDREEIIKKITTLMNKIKWFVPSEETRGKRWEIHFEPVKDNEGKEIESIFVIVVYIAQCQGGVFVEEPECYYIADGEVKKLDFAEWKQRIVLQESHEKKPVEKIDSKQGSDHADEGSYTTYEVLAKMLYNCSWSDLKLQASVSTQSSEDVRLICLSKLISSCFRRANFLKAEELLTQYKSLVSNSKSPNLAVFEVMGEYLRCAMERSRGDYKKSCSIAKCSLEKVKQIPEGITTAAFYVLMATVLDILAVQEQDSKRRSSLVSEAKSYYDKTKSHLEQVKGFPLARANIEQKMYTNLALHYSGSSLTGDTQNDSADFDLEAAKDCLGKTNSTVTHSLHGPLSKFRKIQLNLALSSLYYQYSIKETSWDRQKTVIEHALAFARKAEKLATKCELVEMKRYSRNRIDFLEKESIKPHVS